jgi:hypothetical protein
VPLNSSQCQAFNSLLGTRPYDWVKKIAKDRKPITYIYTGMYKTETWPSFMGTQLFHERTYVARPNDPNLWPQYTADPCLSTPCATQRNYIAHGVDQIKFERYRVDYQTPVFCIDQLNTIEEGIQKLAQIAAGYQELPEYICSGFLRTLVLQKAGTIAQAAGLFLGGVQDSNNNPVAIDITPNMFAVSRGQSKVGSQNTLMVNLNANLELSAIGITTTALLATNLSKLTMEYLANMQEDLAAQGYHDKEWLVSGKFSITVDATTRRSLMNANPALTQMYSAADFSKGGAFYSFGVTSGCGDWLFKEEKEQLRFRFRADLDGVDFNGNSLPGAIWIEQVQAYQNVPATFGIKPVYSTDWKNAPIAMFHVYNREARTIYVGDITSVNPDMKFGLARSFMGKWSWKSPDFFTAVDPNTGVSCNYNNDKKNMGYWLGEYDLGIQTIYPETERVILAMREAQPFLRVPRTNTAPNAPAAGDYQSVLAYAQMCGEYNPPAWSLPPED